MGTRGWWQVSTPRFFKSIAPDVAVIMFCASVCTTTLLGRTRKGGLAVCLPAKHFLLSYWFRDF